MQLIYLNIYIVIKVFVLKQCSLAINHGIVEVLFFHTKDDISGPSRVPHMKFLPEQKAQVARYAMVLGNKRVIVRYSK